MKSASEALHEHLVNEMYDAFTAEELQTQTGFTRGSITGFIAKAVKHGMIAPLHKVKREGLRSITMYKVIDPDVTWKFKPKSHGSYKGRTLKGHAQIELPLAEDNNTGLHADNNILVKENYYPLPKTDAGDIWPTPLPSTNPISSRLIDIAAEVENLERKSLSDYSTDDLINEIKRRVK